MKDIWIAMAVLWLGVLPTLGQAQPRPALRFGHLTIEDGLSQNAVHALAQDPAGFLWIGTKDGLNRYDGTGFTVFEHNPFDPATLPSSYVTALLATDDALWVGTQESGLGQLDPSTGRVVRYAHSPRHRITSLAQDRQGNLWLGTINDGAYRLDADDQARPDAPFERVLLGGIEGRESLGVRALLVDRHGTVWIGVEHIVVRVGQDGAHTRYVPRAGSAVTIDEAQVTSLFETRAGDLWVGTVDGLSRFYPSSRSGEPARFVHYPSSSPWPEDGGAAVVDIVEGPRGGFWFASPQALGRFDPATGEETFFRHAPLDPASLSSNYITALLWDRTGVLWVGTNGYGLNDYDAKAGRFETIHRAPDLGSQEVGFSVRALLEDEGSLWISAGVLYRLDQRTGRLQSFEQPGGDHALFGNTGAWSILRARDSTVWFGTYEGLYRRGVDGQVRHYAHGPARPDGLQAKKVYGVFQDRDGALWTVTARHLSRLDDLATGRFTHFEHTPAPDALSFGEAIFPSLHQDADGLFWMGTEDGLVRFDPATGTFYRYRTDIGDPTSLRNESVRAITPDPGDPDVLWLGTAGGGLARFDRRAETFQHITEADGLPNDVVYAVLPDEAGHLWLSTNHGLARYTPATGAVKTYDVHDGLQSNEFNSGAYHRTASGRLYFGGIHGVTTFHPSEVTDNPHVPPVVLTGLRIGNRPVAVGDSTGLLGRALWETDVLRLSHEQNMVTFEFAALDFSAPENNRYAYRMEGFDERWIEAGTERTATYTNLPAGDYTFRVRGSNNDGVWNEEGAALALVVAPPPWLTWWAYLGYALAALGLGAVGVRERRRRERLRHRAERERTHAEQLRALDQAKSRFFANVSHEFRTPLTLTLGPLDDLRAGLYGALPAPMAAQVDLARRSASRVLDLINQILDVSRLEAGRTPLRARRLDLGAFARSLAAGFAPLAERKAIRLEMHTAPVEVWAEAGQLEKIIANLLSNALKFTPSGGTVRLTVEADGQAARLAVRDSGPGIPAAEQAHVFDRFYQVNDGAAARPLGTGIGLALAKELVELHGGTVAVKSEEGFGSTFTVALPLGRDHLTPEQIVDDAKPWAPSAITLQPFADPEGDGALGDSVLGDDTLGEADGEGEDVTTVLIVEDHAEVRAYVRRHLEADYRVIEAADGEAGLAVARERLPDLVLSDVTMPRLDGLGLCRALKADPETSFLPVVLLTAKAAPEDRIDGLAELADDYLTKPFDPAELRARVANLIAQRRHLRERFRQEGIALVFGEDEVVDLFRLGDTGDGVRPAGPDEPSQADRAFLAQVGAALDEHLGDDTLTVERLAEAVGVSRGHLHRQAKALLGQTPSELIRTRRLERAAQLLRAGAGSVSEVAYAVGFKSVAHFSNAFDRHFGCRPSVWASGQE